MRAARAWVSLRARMAEEMRIARSAFARRSSGFGRPMSANTFPLPSTTSIDLAMSYGSSLPLQPCLVLFFGTFEARLNQIDLSLRRLYSRLRFFLEYVQNVHAASESNGVDSPVCISVKIIDNLKNFRTAEPSKGLRVAVLSALLRHVKRKAYRILDLFRE